MAKWNTFKWSDGTKWADANGIPLHYTGFVDRKGYRVSLRLSHTNQYIPGTLYSCILSQASIETGPRSQLPRGYEAFIDRNENSQHISVRINNTASATEELLTETGETLTTETGEPIVLLLGHDFVIDQIHMLVNQRSRRQPT